MFLEATTEIGSRVTGAIQKAARVTGAGFDYLLKTALRESNFDPNLKASTSSATGLFQFIDQTWLSTLKQDGGALGYGRYADAISRTASGRYEVSDPAMRQEIMALRTDPTANAVMAGAFTNRNAAELTDALGRKPTDGELYIAHFLGPSGAARFIRAAAKSPGASAADMFPDAARANRPIFYQRTGQAKSMAEVYKGLVAKHEGAAAVAAVAAVNPPIAPAQTTATAIAARTDVVRPTAAATPAPTLSFADGGPGFHGLFRTERTSPVSATVSELWGARAAAAPAVAAADATAAVTPASTATGSAGPGRNGRPLDLFQFLRPEIQAAARSRA